MRNPSGAKRGNEAIIYLDLGPTKNGYSKLKVISSEKKQNGFVSLFSCGFDVHNAVDWILYLYHGDNQSRRHFGTSTQSSN